MEDLLHLVKIVANTTEETSGMSTSSMYNSKKEK